MFKENKEFWLYIIGIIIFFFVVFFGMRSYLADRSINIFNFNRPLVINNNPVDPDIVEEDVFDLTKTYYALVQTNQGDIIIELYSKSAPNTVHNFIYLATTEYYTNTKFHRLVTDVFIQGGSRNTINEDVSDDHFDNPGYTIDDEINWDSLDFSNRLRAELERDGYRSTPRLASKDIEKYRIAMASAGPNTSGSQFFIVLGDKANPQINSLRGRHTIFGEIIEGFDTLQKINKISVDSSFYPQEDIVIENIEIYSNN
jgi:peptidyl-prolyl cis-trans isomerase A (cyclophilin A)